MSFETVKIETIVTGLSSFQEWQQRALQQACATSIMMNGKQDDEILDLQLVRESFMACAANPFNPFKNKTYHSNRL